VLKLVENYGFIKACKYKKTPFKRLVINKFCHELVKNGMRLN